MDTEAWQAMVSRVVKSRTRLKPLSTHAEQFYSRHSLVLLSILWLCPLVFLQNVLAVQKGHDTMDGQNLNISVSLHMWSFVIGIKGISMNISGSVSLLNFLSDTVLKLQVTRPSPNSVSPHLSQVTMLCFVFHSCSIFCILVSKIIKGFTVFVFLLLRNRIA